MGNAFFNPLDYQAIKPEILLTMFGLAVLLFDFLLDKRDKYLNAVLALIGLGFALLQLGIFWPISAPANLPISDLTALLPSTLSPLSPN